MATSSREGDGLGGGGVELDFFLEGDGDGGDRCSSGSAGGSLGSGPGKFNYWGHPGVKAVSSHLRIEVSGF